MENHELLITGSADRPDFNSLICSSQFDLRKCHPGQDGAMKGSLKKSIQTQVLISFGSIVA